MPSDIWSGRNAEVAAQFYASRSPYLANCRDGGVIERGRYALPKKQQLRRWLQRQSRAGRSRKGPRAVLVVNSDRESSDRKNRRRNQLLRSPTLPRTRSTPAPCSQIG